MERMKISLGIPTIKDRVIQTAVKLVLEPIFEADFTPNAHGYRPGHSALQAVAEVHAGLRAGATDVVDADLSKFFDTIPHAELMKSVARRVSDGAMLHLIKMWLEAPSEETDERGGRTRRNSGCKGTPQGGVISPLLANIYVRRFLNAWEERDHEHTLRAHIVNYADDLVILCRGTAECALAEARAILTRIGLTVNEQKTRVCQVWKQPFDFLGYSFGPCYAVGTGRPYLGARPSAKGLAGLRETLRDMTGRATLTQSVTELIGDMNRVLQGWANYFSYGTLSKAYRAVDAYAAQCVRTWLLCKHKERGPGTGQYPDARLNREYGLTSLTRQLAAHRKPSG